MNKNQIHVHMLCKLKVFRGLLLQLAFVIYLKQARIRVVNTNIGPTNCITVLKPRYLDAAPTNPCDQIKGKC